MSDCHVHLAKPAAKEIRKLDKAEQKFVVERLDQLQKNPRPQGVEKLRGRPDIWRIRARHFRIIYSIPKPGIVIVLVVRDRKDAYKGLEEIDAKLAHAIEELSQTQLGQALLQLNI